MIATIEPAEQVQTLKPLVQYFDAGSTHKVMPGEMVHAFSLPAQLKQSKQWGPN